MSKAAIASLAKEIYEEAISKNIRKGTKGQNDGLDDKTHVFLINRATVID